MHAQVENRSTVWFRRLGRTLDFTDLGVIRVLALNSQTAEERLHELAGWHYDRLMNTSRACVGTGMSLLAGLLASQFKQELKVDPLWIALAAAGAAALVAFGLIAYARLRAQAELYAFALLLLRL